MKLVHTVGTWNSLQHTALMEASRLGQRDADLEHVFLAVLLSEQSAGQVMRRHGIGLEAARNAIVELRDERLASLGIRIELDPGDIGSTSGGELTDRAFSLMSSCFRKGTTTGLLRALLDEPSGTIAEILERLGVAPEPIRDDLDDIARLAPGIDEPLAPAHQLSGRCEAFVPVDQEQLWQFLLDPQSMTRWGPHFTAVTDAPVLAEPGDEWDALAADPAGSGSRPHRQIVQLVEAWPRTALTWRFTYPDTPRANERHIQLGLSPAVGGCQLAVTVTWQPHPRRRRPLLVRVMAPALRVALAPLHRAALHSQARQIGDTIARAFC